LRRPGGPAKKFVTVNPHGDEKSPSVTKRFGHGGPNASAGLSYIARMNRGNLLQNVVVRNALGLLALLAVHYVSDQYHLGAARRVQPAFALPVSAPALRL
jgi:hypothetical protein